MVRKKLDPIPFWDAVVHKFPEGWHYRLGSDPSHSWLGPFKSRQAAERAREEAMKFAPSASTAGGRHLATKKSPAQLQCEIDEVLAKPVMTPSASGKPSNARERFNVDQPEDKRPGFYYVTAIDAGRSARAAGPYKTHAEALDDVRRVKETTEEMDPRAVWWAWGTMRSEKNLGPGFLDASTSSASRYHAAKRSRSTCSHATKKDVSKSARSKPVSKPGPHGTLYRYSIIYTDQGDSGFGEATWNTWAYDPQHAVDRFYESPDGDTGWVALRIACQQEAPAHRWTWHSLGR